MAVEYTNRKGDVYYLHEGRTRTGKPKYFVSRKRDGDLADALPEGFEIYESPEAGMVFLRKARPTAVTPFERELVCNAIRRQAGLEYFLVDVEPNGLVVYLPAAGERDLAGLLQDRLFLSPPRLQANRDWFMARGQYTKMMRFELVDQDRRLFHVERWCFLGGIDRWIFLDGPATLAKLSDKYVKHLGKESFFELI